MREEDISVEHLIMLLGCRRNDREALRLIGELGDEAVCTVDNEDGADDEYVEVKNRGFSLYFDAGRLASIFLYSEQKEPGYRRYALPLPSDISFGQSKPDVLLRLGSPSASGGGTKGFLGHVSEWIKYEKERYSLHVEFSNETGLVQMVTLIAC